MVPLNYLVNESWRNNIKKFRRIFLFLFMFFLYVYNYLYLIDHFIFTSNDRFFKNIYNPIIFIRITNEV